MIKKEQKKTNCETGWGRDQFVRMYLLKKGFIEVIWYIIWCITSLFLEMISHNLFLCFGTVPSYCLHYRRFFLYGLGWYIRCKCASRCIWSNMHNTLVVVFLRVNKSVLSYLPTPPLGQDMTQGQFLSGV